MEVFGVGEWY